MAAVARRLLLLLALLAGAIGGFTGRRHEERAPLPPARHRGAALKQALFAYETGDGGGARSALAAFGALGRAPREDVAEAALIEALLGGGHDGALRRVEAAWPSTQAAARAAWERVQRAAAPAGRAAARAAFVEAYPDAWVLQRPAGRAGS